VHASAANFTEKHSKEVQENKDGLELNETHQLLVCVDDVHLLDKSIKSNRKTSWY
jgi:hypothetical protein